MGETGEAKTAIRTAAPEDDGCCVCGKSCAIINTILADVGCCFFYYLFEELIVWNFIFVDKNECVLFEWINNSLDSIVGVILWEVMKVDLSVDSMNRIELKKNCSAWGFVVASTRQTVGTI